MRDPAAEPTQPAALEAQPAVAAAAPLPDLEPRWTAMLAILATAALDFILPDQLLIGPRWLMPVIISALMVVTAWAHRTDRMHLNRILGHVAGGLLTAAMVWSLASLILRLPSHKDSPQELLQAAVTLWFANILVFAAWYWRLDAGGPNMRDQRKAHIEGAFQFPQMVLSGKSARAWRPGFIDYLFLAFNTSTAFSPTDVPVLSRWAKVMMMIQALISLVTVAIVAARAVNIL